MIRLAIVIPLLMLCLLGAGGAWGAERSVQASLAFYPDDQPGRAGTSTFIWPDELELSAVVSLTLAGYSSEEKIEVFLVVFNEQERVVSKHKGKHYLPAGVHDIVFPAILSTEGWFGHTQLTAKVEVALAGAVPGYASTAIELEGPDPPQVEIWDLQLVTGDGTPNSAWFEPGEEFGVEATFEVRDNPTDLEPMIIVYGVVDEDSNLVDPDYNYQPYLIQWDLRRLGFREGMFHLQAFGRLPEHFYFNNDSRHDFRIWIVVDFGQEARTKDYAAGEILDYNAGEHRASDEVEQRLIAIERSINWELTRVRRQPAGRERFED